MLRNSAGKSDFPPRAEGGQRPAARRNSGRSDCSRDSAWCNWGNASITASMRRRWHAPGAGDRYRCLLPISRRRSRRAPSKPLDDDRS